MDQRRLEYFVAVAEELNFTRAAQRLHVTQSTLSAGIKALENDLRVELLARSTRSVSLTEAGRAFLPEARAGLEALDRARAAVEPLSAGLRGSLTVGVLSGLTVVDVPALVGDFHRRYPAVRLRTETSHRGTNGHLERVKEGHVDVAFVGADLRGEQHLEARPIKRYEVQILVPSDHQLTRHPGVRLSDLVDETFIDMPKGFGQREAVDDAFRKAELARRVLIEVSDITTVPDYVAHGLGAAFLPAEFAALAASPVRAVPLVDADVAWTLSAVISAGRPRSRALYAFLDLIPHHIRGDRVF